MDTAATESRSGLRLRLPYDWLFLTLVLLTLIGNGLYNAVQKVKFAAQRSNEGCHVKQLALGLLNYAEDNGHLPPAYTVGPDGKPWHSWRIEILPYTGYQDLYDQYRFDEPWDGPNNRQLHDKMPSIFRSSFVEDEESQYTNYLAVTGPNTLWPGAEPLPLDVTGDKIGDTIMLISDPESTVHWLEPSDFPVDQFETWPSRVTGSKYGLVDTQIGVANGSTHYMPFDISPEVFRVATAITSDKSVDISDGQWQLRPADE